MHLRLVTLLFCVGCSATAPAYFVDREFRREELVASLMNPANDYSQLRLAHYATSDGSNWDLLPEWNPRSERIELSELAGGVEPRVLGANAHAIAISDEAKRGDPSALAALGEIAFFSFPLEIAPEAALALQSVASTNRYGFWTHAEAGVASIVRVEEDAAATTLAYTCATCHAAVHDGALVVGLGNDQLELGQLLVDSGNNQDAQVNAALVAWGRGRLDVTTSNGREPVAISDLRPTHDMSYLQHDATLAQRNLISLAIRVETLIITAHAQKDRPPREIALALATYIWSLSATLENPPPPEEAGQRGQSLFERSCSGCHVPPTFTGPPVPLVDVGTDPTVGLSRVRGTGSYRVPSLRGVADRRLLLHDASLSSLESLFDPQRTAPTYQGGVRPGPVVGHAYTLAFDANERADLIAFLRTL